MTHEEVPLSIRWEWTFEVLDGVYPLHNVTREAELRGFALVENAYSEPHRKYHTTEHLKACFRVVDRVFKFVDPQVELALWFHDLVYDRAWDNEAQSARLGKLLLEGMGIPDVDVTHLILATQHEAVPETDSARVVVDVDLSILGEEPDLFDLYERQIRAEYAWVPDAAYVFKRLEILQRFLEREWIYATAEMRRDREGQARQNIQRSVDQLRSQIP